MTEQGQPRTRTRSGIVRSAQPSQRGQQQRTNDTSWMHQGSDAREQQRREAEETARRRERGWKPPRFWLRPGEQADLIILDNEPGPCFYEHRIRNQSTGKWDIEEACPKEWESCPLCAQHGESYYVMMLTVIDMTPFTDKNGNQREYSRKLLPVKSQQMPFFYNLHEIHGNLRGAHILTSRDNDKTFAIGNPQLDTRHGENGFHSEEEILEAFGHGEIRSQDGQRVIRQANEDCTPVEYGKVFERPSGEDLRRRFGGVAPAGSRQEQQQAWGEREPGDHQAPAQQERPQRGGITRSSGAASQAPASGDGGSSSSRGGIGRSAPAHSSGGSNPDPDDAIPF